MPEEYRHLLAVIVIAGVEPPPFETIEEVVKAHSILAGRDYQYEYDFPEKGKHTIHFSCYAPYNQCAYIVTVTKSLATEDVEEENIQTCQFLLSDPATPYREFKP